MTCKKLKLQICDKIHMRARVTKKLDEFYKMIVHLRFIKELKNVNRVIEILQTMALNTFSKYITSHSFFRRVRVYQS